MKYLKDKKIIGCIALVSILSFVSLYIYGQEKESVFKDEYMKSIFVDEEGVESGVNNEEVILKKSEVTVEIKGEVKEPKVYTLSEGSIINDLIEKAGGLTEEANISNINRAKILKNEDLIVIGNINSVEDSLQVTGNTSTNNDGDNTSQSININTATISELMNIDGVGEKTAQKIIDYREQNGGFKTIEDIKNVDRIGDKTFENMKGQISC